MRPSASAAKRSARRAAAPIDGKPAAEAAPQRRRRPPVWLAIPSPEPAMVALIRQKKGWPGHAGASPSAIHDAGAPGADGGLRPVGDLKLAHIILAMPLYRPPPPH